MWQVNQPALIVIGLMCAIYMLTHLAAVAARLERYKVAAVIGVIWVLTLIAFIGVLVVELS